MFFTETDTIVIDDVEVTIFEVQSDAAVAGRTDALQSDLRVTAGNASIVLRVLDGNVDLHDGYALTDNTAIFAHGLGNILIDVRNRSSIANVKSDIVSERGHISVLVGHDIWFTYAADIRTGDTGSINVVSDTGSVRQHDFSRFEAELGDIRVVAYHDIVLGGVTTTARVALIALNGSILDAGDRGGEDIIAATARLSAGNGIGGMLDAIETRVDILAANAHGGGIFILETDDLIVDDVAASIWEVWHNASVHPVTESTLSDVYTLSGDGSIVLRTLAGRITLNPGSVDGFGPNSVVRAHGNGHILIQSLGSGHDIIVASDIASTTGAITLIASGSIVFTTGVNVQTSGNGSIEAIAQGGRVEQTDSNRFIAERGDVRVWALSDVFLGGITTFANASVHATNGSIFDTGDVGGEDIIATGAWLNAGIGVGTANDRLELRVDILTSRATAGGIHILETDNLVVGDVTLKTWRVSETSEGSQVIDTQSDLRTTAGNGSISLETIDGSITLLDGSRPADDTAVAADGSGSVTIVVGGDDSVLAIHADVRTVSGTVSFVLRGDHATLLLDADIRAGSSPLSLSVPGGITMTSRADIVTAGGDIEITVQNGDLMMASGATIVSGGGDIRLFVQGSFDVSIVDASTGLLDLVVNGSVRDNHEDDADNFAAAFATVRIDGDFGTREDLIDTAFGYLDLIVYGSGGAFVEETDSVHVTNFRVPNAPAELHAGGSMTIDAFVVTAPAGDIKVSAGDHLTIIEGLALAFAGGVSFSADSNSDGVGRLTFGRSFNFFAAPSSMIELAGAGITVGDRNFSFAEMKFGGEITPIPDLVSANAAAFTSSENLADVAIVAAELRSMELLSHHASSFVFIYPAPSPALLTYSALQSVLSFTSWHSLFTTNAGIAVFRGTLASSGLLLVYASDVTTDIVLLFALSSLGAR